MTRTLGTLAFLAVAAVILYCTLAGAAAAQTEPPSGSSGTAAAGPPPAPIDGEPIELHELAVRLNDLHSKGGTAEVRRICQEQLAADTSYEHRAYFLWYIGRTHAKDKAYDRAIGIYKQVLEQYPRSQQVWWAKYYMAKAYESRGSATRVMADFTTAAAICTQLIADYPDQGKADHPRKLLAVCYERQGKMDLALAEYEKSVGLYPKAISRLQGLGRWDEALLYQQRLLAALPPSEQAPVQLGIGYSLAGKGDMAAAISAFDKVPAQYPLARDVCANALYQKALCQKALGQPDAARATLQSLLTTYSDQPAAAQAKATLEQMAPQ